MSSVLKTDERPVARKRSARETRTRRQVNIPLVSPFLLRGFNWYVPRYLRRHFNAVRVAKQTIPDLPGEEAVVCFANHPGWWDPLVAFLLNQLYLSGRTVFAPIDQAALKQYPIFRRLGFYGIDMDSLEGAKQFVSITRRLLEHPTTAIWLTPGGKFADVRTRTTFQAGLGHIAASVSKVTLLPVAVEYTFWEERTPEALVEFGQPIRTLEGGRSKEEWQRELEDRLAAAQASLAAKAISRQTTHFDTALDGSSGVGGFYDLLRRGKSLMSLQPFDPRHGGKPTRSRGDG